jgi:hypothetical protein
MSGQPIGLLMSVNAGEAGKAPFRLEVRQSAIQLSDTSVLQPFVGKCI